MTIKVTYNVTDVYVTQDVSPVYINVSYSSGGGSGAAVWGGITGTLSDQTDLQTALDLKVPYTGATTNVNLGEYEIKAGQVTLDTSPTGTAAVGTTRWNDTTGLTETTLKGGNVILKNGVDLVARVVNKVTPNTTLTKAAYQAVRVSGAQGQRLAVAFAQANNDNNSADTIGLVTETIATNQEGFIITVGQLENINTTGSLQGETWADGDVLYLSPTTAGALTNVKPNATIGHIVVIGYVEYAHANNGKIYVKVMNGWELGELHDVYVPTPSNNDVLTYETSSGLWKNKSIATALGYTPANATTTLTINGVTYDLSTSRSWTISAGISGSGASGQVAYWTGTSAQSGSNNLFWDNTKNVLAIKSTIPSTVLSSASQTFLGQAADIYASNSANDCGFNVNFYTDSTGVNKYKNNGFISSFYFDGNGNISLFTGANGIAGNNITISEKVKLLNNGNLLIQNGGTFTDSGQRLQVNGDTLLKGSGNTSATTALLVENSDGSDLIKVFNNGALAFSNGSDLQIYSQQNSSRSFGIGSGFAFQSSLGSGVNGPDFRFFNGFVGSALTSGSRQGILVNSINFAPTSGTATYTILQIESIINQTGGANGITRGLYVNPTLTAAADWRSIEWSNNSGWGLYGAGSANNYMLGSLLLGTTTQRLKLTISGSDAPSPTLGTASGSMLVSNSNVNYGMMFGVSTAGWGWIQQQRVDANATSYFLSLQPAGGNVIIGSTTDTGQKLQVTGIATISSSALIGSTSSTGENLQVTGTAKITSKLSMGAGTTSNAQINLASSTAPTSPNNGDIWFDGTDIKMRIGGVTKTFTLV